MRSESLEPILVSLFLLIETIAGYPVPDSYPSIQALPQAEIAKIVCGRPCPVRAAYTTDRGVLIDDTLDLRHDAFGQSVLAHELVHFLQDQNGTFSEAPRCRRQSEREREAYWVQAEYLLRTSGQGMTGLHYSNRFLPRCFDE